MVAIAQYDITGMGQDWWYFFSADLPGFSRMISLYLTPFKYTGFRAREFGDREGRMRGCRCGGEDAATTLPQPQSKLRRL